MTTLVKKTISLLIFLAMAVSCFAGCQANDPIPSQGSTEGSSTTVATTPPENAPKRVPAKTVFFINRTEKTENDIKIGGYQYIPEDLGENEKLPTVILCHGHMNSADRFDYLAKIFCENGYAVFCFNYAGKSAPKVHDADSTGLGSKNSNELTAARDAFAVMDYVKTLSFVDTDNLFLLGQSMGGWVATYVASERESEVKGLMCYFPAYSKGEGLGDIYAALGKFAGEDQANKEVLICHGDKDSTVSLQHSQKAADLYPNVTLHIIEGAGHAFKDNPAFVAETSGYCLEYLKAHTTTD